MKRLAPIFLVIFAAGQAFAQVSLWGAQGTQSAGAAPAVGPKAGGANLLREVQARDFKVHDIVSVVVSLSAQASTNEAADMEKKTDKVNFAIEQYLRLQKDEDSLLGVNVKGHKPTDLGVDMSSDKKFEGGGGTDRTDTLRTRLSAEIVDIKPNGNLVIEARQKFTKQRETTTVTLSGLVRPQDVGPDNMVYSYNVADADIRYESSGPITDASKRGWLSKVLDRVWPF
jgi:flagellar L-ring protein precursor FlgH